MKGIGKRVTVGFLSIVVLLLASGIISLFELSNLSNDTEVILSTSRRNLEIAKEMIKSAHEHSQAVLHYAIFNDLSKRDASRRALGDLEGALVKAKNEAADASRLDSLAAKILHLREVSQSYVVAEAAMPEQSVAIPESSVLIEVNQSSDGKVWYDNNYKVVYEELMEEIQNFMTHTHTSLAPRAEQLNKNAYRSVAPVFISLVVVIAIVLMFYFFMRIYLVKPIVQTNRSLSDFLTYRLPFSVKAELLDELNELVDNIEKLIAIYKQNKS